uniref:Gustatory receptor n=1 Tax=Timema bartmani TaxID=61472 RepID=A0A7R9ERC6_9NEOP|nr:unnamed protein product [Timema bartmani]
MNVQYVDLVALLISRFKILNNKFDVQVNVDSLKLACQRGTSATCKYLPISTKRSNQLMPRSVVGPSETNDDSMTKKTLLTSDDICMMSKVHDILSDIACSINSMFTVQTLLDMQATFVNVLIILYQGITSTAENSPHLRQEHVFSVTIAWALVSFLKVLMTTAACHYASAEASHTACCLHKMILWQPMGEDQSYKAANFLRQAINSRVQFTACGLFNVDLCFFLSFVGLPIQAYEERGHSFVLTRLSLTLFQIHYFTEKNLEVSDIEPGTARPVAFIGEEDQFIKGTSIALTDSPTWIIDPIDGTQNFVHALHFVYISIALSINKQVVLGIAYNPILDILFTAKKGQGAYLNLQPIHVSQVTEMSKALVGANLINFNPGDELEECIFNRIKYITSSSQRY